MISVRGEGSTMRTGWRHAVLRGVTAIALAAAGTGTLPAAELDWFVVTDGAAIPRPAEGTARTLATAVATDDSGTVVVGEFSDTVDFDPTDGVVTLDTTSHGPDGFVARYSGDGKLEWARKITGPVAVEPTDVAIGPAGDVTIVGDFWGPTDFDPGVTQQILEPPGTSSDGFVLRLDAQGRFRWVRQHGSNGYTSYAVAIDASGATWVAGRGHQPSSLLKLDPNGATLWQAETEFEPFGLAVGARDAVVVVGRFAGTQDLDPGPGVEVRTSNGHTDLLVASLAMTGSLSWVVTLGGSDPDQAHAVAVGPSGWIFATGSFQGVVDFDPDGDGAMLLEAVGRDIFVLALSVDGTVAWARGMGGAASESGRRIVVGTPGNVVVTGTFRGAADFDPGPGVFELVPPGGTHNLEAYVVELTTGGAFSWAGHVGGHDQDLGFDVAVGPSGGFQLGGQVRSNPADLDPTTGTTGTSLGGSSELFLVQMTSTIVFTDGFESGTTASWVPPTG